MYSLLCTVTVVLMLYLHSCLVRGWMKTRCLLFQSVWVSLEGDAVGFNREAVFRMQRSHWLFLFHHISRENLNCGSVPEGWKGVLNCMPLFYPISVQLKSMCGVLYSRSLFLDRIRSTIAKCCCCAPAEFLTVMAAAGAEL